MAAQGAMQDMGAIPGGMPPSMTPDKGGMFKHQAGIDVSPIYNELNSLSARLRIAEERYTNLRKKSQLVEQNMLTGHKNTNLEVKSINAELNEIKREISDVKNKISLMINEFQTFAKKDELKVVEKYVNLWEPMKYVTQNEVENIVRKIMEEEKHKKSDK